MGDLSCTVRTEVKEDNGVTVIDRCQCFSVFSNYKWYNELIGLSCIIGSLDAFCCTYCCISFALCKSLVS